MSKQKLKGLWIPAEILLNNDLSDKEKIISYMFEAFDEPWKGGSRPNEAEKNWGIFRVDRTPKLIMQK